MSDRDYSFCRHVQFITSERQNFELGDFSIGYIQFITSELTDSQASSLNLVGNSSTVISSLLPLNGKVMSLVASQSVMSSQSSLN